MPHDPELPLRRAVLKTRFIGYDSERELWERELERRGWPILERRGQTQSNLGESLTLYLIEVRFHGSALRASTAARNHVSVAAQRIGIDLAILAVDSINRTTRGYGHWMIFQDMVETGSWPQRLWIRWRRAAARTLGTRDVGRQVWARDEATALLRGQEELPGTRSPSPPISVRGELGIKPRPRALILAESGASRDWRIILLGVVLLAVAYGSLLGQRSEYDWNFLNISLIGLAVFSAPIGAISYRAWETSNPIRLQVSSVALSAFALFVGIISTRRGTDQAPAVYILTLLALFIFAGIVINFRYSSGWRSSFPWLLPTLLPLGVLLLPGVSFSLHVSYLDRFGFSSEDVDISSYGQAQAAGKMLAFVAVALIGPAVIGYARYFHLTIRERWLPRAMSALMVIYTLSLMGYLPLRAADQAGSEAIRTAERGDIPSEYFGIQPQWVCLRATVPYRQLPVAGGPVHFKEPYLLLGGSNGNAALWDPSRMYGLKIPVVNLQLERADSGLEKCRS